MKMSTESVNIFSKKRLRAFLGILMSVSLFVSSAPIVHASGPTPITSCAQLQLIGSGDPSYPSTGSYILNGPSNTIDCSSINSGNGFSRIQNFTGTLDGNNNTIIGLYENDPSNNDVGLFEDIESGGVVENFTITNSIIVGLGNVGVVAGVSNGGTIQNVTVGTGTVSGVTNVGGLIGENSGAVSNSSASVRVSSTDPNAQNLGGLVGFDDGAGSGITNSYATGNVIGLGDNASNIGGLSGLESGGITNSYATGDVIGGLNAQDVGGAIGDYAGGAITRSYATGDVSAGNNSQAVGGFVGNADGTSLSFDYATGSVSGNNGVGGFAGYADVPISDSYSSGPVAINGDGTGQGPQNVGGFIGTVDGTTVTDSYATGNVVVSGTFLSAPQIIGGFVGQDSANVSNTYATGSVTSIGGSIDVGGYVGHASSLVSNSFSVGTVTAPASTNVGGFVGSDDNALLTNNGWYTGIGGDGANAVGYDQIHGASTVALLATNGYGTDESDLSRFYNVTEPAYDLGSGWDFDTTWVPHLNSFPTLGISDSTFNITATAGAGGSISPSGVTVVARNTPQSFSISAASGYSLGTVTVDGVSQSTSSSYTFTHVYTPHTIMANFTQNLVVSTLPISSGGVTGGCVLPNIWNAQTMKCQPPITAATPTSVAQIIGSGTCPASLTITDNLKLGDKDGTYDRYNTKTVTQVSILQKQINRILLASYKQAAGPTDGIFGSLTKQGVQRLQGVLNDIVHPAPLLKIDGTVGPFTKAALNNSCS